MPVAASSNTQLRVILDHTIVGQELTGLEFRKDREYAACRLCGAVFQSAHAISTLSSDYTANVVYLIALETRQWRDRHNKTHPDRDHIALTKSGRTFTPEAALRLASFGLVSLDSDDTEVAHALLSAPRLPASEPERF